MLIWQPVLVNRRALLSAFASASTLGLGGCLDQNTIGSGRSDAGDTRSANHRPEKPVRCRGDPISASREVTDSPGYEDNIEYFPSNQTVRFVATMSGDGPESFETMPFEQWGSIESAEVGLEKVREVTEKRLETDDFGSGMGDAPGFFNGDMAITLSVATRVEDDETVTPSLSLSKLADNAPKSANVTVSLDGDEYSRTVPVYAEHVRVGAL